MSANGGIT
jgi:hypothetical protein